VPADIWVESKPENKGYNGKRRSEDKNNEGHIGIKSLLLKS
jgi:hypothetical protein